MPDKAMTRLVLIAVFVLPPAALGQEAPKRSERAAGDNAAQQKLDLKRVAELIVEKTDMFRKEHDRNALRVDPKLQSTAQYFADFMAKTDKYGHTADDKRPAERAAQHGYEYCLLSENIAYADPPTGATEERLAEKFFESWINSAVHRKNIVEPHVTDTGVAVARSEKSGNFYAVQMFGRPKSASFSFVITNETAEPIEYQVGEQEFELPPRFARTHQQCVPSQVTFSFSGGAGKEEKTETIEPTSDDRFIVKQFRGKFRVEKAKVVK